MTKPSVSRSAGGRDNDDQEQSVAIPTELTYTALTRSDMQRRPTLPRRRQHAHISTNGRRQTANADVRFRLWKSWGRYPFSHNVREAHIVFFQVLA